jgi:hypothetical protein
MQKKVSPPQVNIGLNDLNDVSTVGAASDDVLTFDGTEWISAPVPSSGGSPDHYVFQISSTDMNFEGSLFNSWNSTRLDQGTGSDITYDTPTNRFIFNRGGLWEVSISGLLQAGPGINPFTDNPYLIPDGLMSYGLETFADNGAQDIYASSYMFTRFSASGSGDGENSILPTPGGSNQSLFVQHLFATPNNSGSMRFGCMAYQYSAFGVPALVELNLNFARIGDYNLI